MRPLTEVLEKINKAVSDYETKELGLIHDQAEILRNLSTGIYFLAEHKTYYHNLWMALYFQCKETTAAAKERFADKNCPELYKVRQIMAAATKVQDSLRSTISINKN